MVEGYTLLEYIESDGTQYIDTGFKPNQDTKVVLDFYSSGASSYKCICGARIKNGDDCFAFWIKDDIAHPQIADNLYNKYSFNVSTKQRIIYIIDKNVATFGTSSVTMDSSTFQSQYNLYLFNCNQAGTAASNYFIRGKLYSCQIYDNGTLVRDYIPCMNMEGVYGLYDKVNGVFYASATDSGFTGKWAENKTLNVSMSEYRHRMMNLIPKTGLPKGYFRCEYIESDGANLIDTGFKPNNNTRVTCDFEFMTTPSKTMALFGARTSASSENYAFLYASSTGKLRSDYNKSYNQEFDYITGRFQIDKNKETTTISGESKSYTNASFSSSYNLYLFALNQADTAQWYATARIYSCQIYDNGVKVRDYVPCVSPDGYFGLYDLVTNEFYGFIQKGSVRSYTVNTALYGSWNKDEGTNPDTSKYDGMYYSVGSQGVDNGYDIMRITINGYDEFTCYIRSYAESIYDYTVIGDLDTELTYSKVPGDVGVKAHTQGNQESGTYINSYTKVVYTGIGGGTHFIDVMYKKDRSDYYGDDRGYLLIDKTTVSSGETIQVIGRGKVTLPGRYANAEYIESSGTQYIGTDFFPSFQSRVVVDFSEVTGNGFIFGCRNENEASATQAFNVYRNSSTTIRSDYFGLQVTGSLSSMTDRGIIDKDGPKTTIYDLALNNTSVASGTSDYGLVLFGLNNVGTIQSFVSMRMHMCQIFDNGVFVRFYIPCKRDGVFGLYEMFEGIFYSSEGSSEFKGESDGDNEGSGSLPDYSAYRGVYIEDVDGYLYAEAEWDGSKTANGVAVLTDNCRFVIALQDANGSNTTKWTDPSFYKVEGVTNTDSFTDACKDYNGRNNTDVMISDLNTGALSANYCKSYDFPNGQKGYLGAAGEWQSALDNKAAIESALSKCGGTSLDEGMTEFYWTSTQYTDFESWVADWSYVELNYLDKGLYASVRAFTPLKQDVQIISFWIGGVEYQAEEGMTWGKWIDSKFNTDGYFIEASGNYIADASGNYIGLDGVFVRPSEVIQEGTSYLLV